MAVNGAARRTSGNGGRGTPAGAGRSSEAGAGDGARGTSGSRAARRPRHLRERPAAAVPRVVLAGAGTVQTAGGAQAQGICDSADPNLNVERRLWTVYECASA